MPLSALVFYISSKFEYETKRKIRDTQRENYLFNALRAMLILKPNAYYEKYPLWSDITAEAKKRSERPADFDEDDVIGMFK